MIIKPSNLDEVYEAAQHLSQILDRLALGQAEIPFAKYPLDYRSMFGFRMYLRQLIMGCDELFPEFTKAEMSVELMRLRLDNSNLKNELEDLKVAPTDGG